jgi:hypothetical protein
MANVPLFEGRPGTFAMNAPATPAAMRPDPPVVAAPNLLAWEFIRTLVGVDTTSRESNLADRVCVT